MTWDAASLADVLRAFRRRHGDSTLIEVKKAQGGMPTTLNRTLCAFANTPAGGTIILGVDERADFAVTGIADVAAMEQAVTDCNRESVNPCPTLSFTTVTLETGDVLIVAVAPLPVTERPAYTEGKAYRRQADGEYVMQPHELRMIEVERLHDYSRPAYDERPLQGTSIADLDPQIVAQFVASVRARMGRLSHYSDEEILRFFAVLTASGEVTVAGLAAMGIFPQGRIPSLTVNVAVRGASAEGTRELRHHRQLTGPVPVLLEDIMAWAAEAIPAVSTYDSRGHMVHRHELPLRAVRELAGNALVHRDLGPDTLEHGQEIQIRLEPRRLFVSSPGGLRGVSLEAVLSDSDHAQAAVNQRLYHVCQFLSTPDGTSVIEGEGGGLIEVRQAARQWGLDAPQIIDTGSMLIASLWRPDGQAPAAEAHPLSAAAALPEVHEPGSETVSATGTASERAARMPRSGQSTRTGARVSQREKDVLRLLEDGPATVLDLAERSGLAAHQVRYTLRRAIARGRAVMEGGQGQHGTVYRLP